ncbi:MAG TPA: enolase C-terminal domain-like protein [Steroidobacteraceae bacterium]|nr:enolase C-terminal domain-like protein [Steroidobacteraceae bacterium]
MRSADCNAGEATPIRDVRVAAFRIPTETPESDGTFAWNATTLVLVEIDAGRSTGMGYTYADQATAVLIHDELTRVLMNQDAWATQARWMDLRNAVRNIGSRGIAAMAISALDVALWDWKGKQLGIALCDLFGRARDAVELYGSGGFTSYSDEQLRAQLGGWARHGFHAVKMKVARDADRDEHRVRVAREAIGSHVQLFVDANGGYSVKQALLLAGAFAEQRVTWFEEPVSSDDLAGLALIRNVGPAGMAISAGEYGYSLDYFQQMLSAQAIDVLQADATRCCGFTGFLSAAALCEARNVPLSSHCAPALHLHVACAARPLIHMEYFFDHVRIERMLFDGAVQPNQGQVAPDRSRPGVGLEFKWEDAQCYRL